MAQKVELRIDDVLVYPPDGTAPPPTPTPPPVPPPVVVPPSAPGDRLVNVLWPAAGIEQMQTNSMGMVTGATAFRFVVPLDFVSRDPTHTGQVTTVEVPGHLRTPREMGVSKTAFDFNPATCLYYTPSVINPGFTFGVGAPAQFSTITLKPGNVIYVNIRNWYRGVPILKPGQLGDCLFNLKTPNSY